MYKFEDLVAAINAAPNEFSLSHIPFDQIKQALNDLQKRLHALEAHPAVAVTVPPLGG